MIDIKVKTPEDIGEIIRKVRKNQGIRQDDLAGYIDSSHVFMRDAERGKPSVQLGRVMRALDELGIKVTLQVPDAFMQRKPKRTPSK
ncbi:transcriptional regulator [Stenotrophomonas sp.]|uniref:transcriptional regulator n=1 Tax=Stenotrophomonas sp. TaxID=69392 RepID=UPI0028AA16AD|nr:transcriptional regulator [Stenotrophomonas sp.]